MKSNISKLPQAKVEPVKQATEEEIDKTIDDQSEEPTLQDPVVAQESSVKPDTVMIELPLLPIEGYVRKRVDVTFTSAEAHALKSVKNALEAKSAQLSNGKYVTSVSDAVRWIVQQIEVAR